MVNERFKAFLKEKGITQNEAAELLGISVASVSAKARGKQDFKVKEIKKFMKAYDMEPVEIVNVFLK